MRNKKSTWKWNMVHKAARTSSYIPINSFFYSFYTMWPYCICRTASCSCGQTKNYTFLFVLCLHGSLSPSLSTCAWKSILITTWQLKTYYCKHCCSNISFEVKIHFKSIDELLLKIWDKILFMILYTIWRKIFKIDVFLAVK